MSRVIVVLLALILCAAVAQAQAPGLVHVMLPNGNNYVQSTAANGTLSSGGITCTWSTGANSATVNFTGNYTTGWIHPSVDLGWFWSADNLPVAVTVTCNGPNGTYDFGCPFLPSGTSWDWSHNQSDLSGDWGWGTYLPSCDRFDIEVGLNDQGVDYDLTIYFEWGAGVPNAATTWGAMKALYR